MGDDDFRYYFLKRVANGIRFAQVLVALQTFQKALLYFRKIQLFSDVDLKQIEHVIVFSVLIKLTNSQAFRRTAMYIKIFKSFFVKL